MARPTGRPIREELIDAACAMVQRVGVNSFSYGDLAKQLEISAPSIHHHFRTKDDLIGEVAARYRSDFNARRDAIDAPTQVESIMAFSRLFTETSARKMMCFCGAVAADWPTVGARAHDEVQRFFPEQVAWLAARLESGIASGEFDTVLDATAHSTAMLAGFEGALLMSRASGDTRLVESVCSTMIDLVRRS